MTNCEYEYNCLYCVPLVQDFQRGDCFRSNCKYSHDASKLQRCGDFQKGNCRRENCRYAHVLDTPKPRSLDICADFQAGMCHRENCRYQHVRDMAHISEHMDKV